jgi:diacylglycerol O-acyltransferase / wax synthase
MKQLSGLDASFLYMEDSRQFAHVSSLSVFRKPPDNPSYDPYNAWRNQIERRLHLAEPFRRRLRTVPFGLDHPFWINDPDFDLDFHVRHNALPPPGTDEQLAELVARIIAKPLDRQRPLWETYVIEGLPNDRFALLTKVHHATIDGASGAELLVLMLDTERAAVEVEQVDDWLPETEPTDSEMVRRALVSLTHKPGRGLLLAARTARELGVATRNPVLVAAADRFRAGLRGPLGAALNVGRPRDAEMQRERSAIIAPNTPFNARIGPHRRFAFRSVPLDDVKRIKNATGATVNDVVMAVCAGGLRRWLIRHDALPTNPLVAMVPVSIRQGDETEKWSNRVSAIFAGLPTNEPDAIARIGRAHDAMNHAKQLFDAVPAASLTDFAQFAPPAVFTQAMRTATRLTGRFGTPVNLVISNVPGPRQPLYAASAEMEHYFPVSMVIDGQGLNITVQSYLDRLDIGLVSCRDLVPDLWDLLGDIVDEITDLVSAVADEPASEPPPRAKKPRRAARNASTTA